MILGTQKKNSESPNSETNVFGSLWSAVMGLFSTATSSAMQSPVLSDSSNDSDEVSENDGDFQPDLDSDDDSENDADYQPELDSDDDSENDVDFQSGTDSDDDSENENENESDCNSELDIHTESDHDDKPFDLGAYQQWIAANEKQKKSSKRSAPEKSVNNNDSDSDAEVKHERNKRHCKR